MDNQINMEELMSNIYNHGKTYKLCSSVSRIYQHYKKTKYNSKLVPIKNFIVNVNKNIPKLSWICKIENQNYNFIVGKGVEFGKNFILEGVWQGSYANLDFYKSDFFYGSGAFVDKNNICRFSPPRLCTDFLYVLYDKINNISYISNSFCFIFAYIDLNINSKFYSNFKKNIHKTTNEESYGGGDKGNPIIVDDTEYTMYRMMYHNFTIDDHGNINYLMKIPDIQKIKTFEEYQKFLINITSNIIKNGDDPLRKNKFLPISMISTGYDSCAVSTIFSKSGGKDAITLKIISRGHDDCGDKIAKILGLNCYICHSPLGNNIESLVKYFKKEDKYIFEFIATSGIGDNVAFLNMEKFITNKIVFSGLYGDGCWSKKGNGGGLQHHLPYMKSRNEFRLRVGYYLVPVPAFGAYFPYMLKKINKLKSMDPYRLHTKYDRPIPRRICEEAGIPRELFGQKKAANNPTIVNHLELFDIAIKEIIKRYKQ